MKKYSGHILIVDDDEHVVLTSKVILKNYFENIETLSTPKTLESKLKQQDFDVILLDMNFQAGVTSGNEGIFWMNRIHQLSPQTQVVMQTAYGDIELAAASRSCQRLAHRPRRHLAGYRRPRRSSPAQHTHRLQHPQSGPSGFNLLGHL